MRLLILGLFCLAYYYSDGKPNGSPQDACFYMTPRHIHPHTYRKVFPTKAMGLYNITTSADVFRPDRPIRVTLWGPPFKGFMMVAAEEGAKDWPSGIFFSDDGSSKRLSCLARGDTVTHQNNSYKDSVSVLWYGPENMMSEQVQFIATVVVNLTIYYTNIKSGFLRLDPSLAAPGGAEGAAGGAVTMDPWLAGQTATRSPWWNQGGAQGGGVGGGPGGGLGSRGGSSAWGLSALLGGRGASSSGQNWGANSNSGWGSSQNSWGNGGNSNGNWGQGTGSGAGGQSSGNTWGNGGWQQMGQPSSGSSWGSGNASSSWQQPAPQNSQSSIPPSSGKSNSEVWSWNWNSKGDAAPAGNTAGPTNPPAPPPAPTTQPPPPTPKAPPAAQAGTATNTAAWSDNNSLQSQSTNIWAKLLDFVLQKSSQSVTPAV